MQAVDKNFHRLLQEKVHNADYIKLQYFTDIREFMTVMSVAKGFVIKEGDEYFLLASGQEVRLDLIVRVDDTVAPQYKDIMDFTCDC